MLFETVTNAEMFHLLHLPSHTHQGYEYVYFHLVLVLRFCVELITEHSFLTTVTKLRKLGITTSLRQYGQRASRMIKFMNWEQILFM